MWNNAIRIGGALICLAGLFYIGAGMYSPNPARWPIIMALAVLCLPFIRLEWPVVLFVVYAGVSLLWTPDPLAGSIYWLHWVALAVLFMAAKRCDDIPYIALAAIVVHTAICIAYPKAWGGTGNENFQAEFLVLAGTICATKRQCWAGFVIAAFHLLVFSPSKSQYVALLAVAFVFSLRDWRMMAGVLVAGVLAMIVTWDSIIDRVEFAYNTLLAWSDHPLFGYGLGGFDYIYPDYAERHLALTAQTKMDALKWYAGAAHNEFIQMGAETGIVGVALLAFALLRNVRNALLLAPLAGLCLVGFPMQNPTTALAAIGLLAVACRPERLHSAVPAHSGLAFLVQRYC